MVNEAAIAHMRSTDGASTRLRGPRRPADRPRSLEPPKPRPCAAPRARAGVLADSQTLAQDCIGLAAAQVAIFQWFPPYDVVVSGTRWLAVMQRLAADSPRTVVPGHGDVGGPQLLADIRDYLDLLRDETWVRRDSAISEDTIVEEIPALMIPAAPGASRSGIPQAWLRLREFPRALQA